MEKLFTYNEIIKTRDDFCNMGDLRTKLIKGALGGHQYVLYGRRDTGKTSIIKAFVIPTFLADCEPKMGKKPFVMFCDLLGVKSPEAIARRLRIAFQQAFAEAFPAQSMFMSAMRTITSMRPSVTMSDSGKLKLTLETQNRNTPLDTAEILRTITEFLEQRHESHKALLVFDEFQDIALVGEAEAIFRDFFQNLPKGSSVLVSGSKKHLLSQIFAPARAPLAGWGETVNISQIPYEEYTEYINERFGKVSLFISDEVSARLQDYLARLPEPINIICQRIAEMHVRASDLNPSSEPSVEHHVVFWEQAMAAVDDYLTEESGKFEEQLRRFSTSQEKFLTAVAKANAPIRPFAKSFLQESELSLGAIQKLLPGLENDADIYHEPHGYVLAQPLLALYLQRTRG